MDTKTLAANWENVEGELKQAIVSLGEDLWRIFGNEARKIDPSAATVDSPLLERMRELYEYGIHGQWNPTWDDLDPEEEDAIFFVQDLQRFRVVSGNAGNAELPLCRYVVECALARMVYDHGIRTVYPQDGQPYSGFSAGDLAYLSGLDERTVRNQMGSKGVLRTVSQDKRAFVPYDAGAEWLRVRGFKETRFIGEETRDLQRVPLSDTKDLGRYLEALMSDLGIQIANACDALRSLLDAIKTGNVIFNLNAAAEVAEQLNLEPEVFAKALARLVADEQQRAIEKQFRSNRRL